MPEKRAQGIIEKVLDDGVWSSGKKRASNRAREREKEEGGEALRRKTKKQNGKTREARNRPRETLSHHH